MMIRYIAFLLLLLLTTPIVSECSVQNFGNPKVYEIRSVEDICTYYWPHKFPDHGLSVPWIIKVESQVQLALLYLNGSYVYQPNACCFSKKDKLILVSPLWRDKDGFRVIIADYNVNPLPLPKGTKILKVLVPMDEGKIYSIEVPCREIEYKLSDRDNYLLLEPELNTKAFFVEADLPLDNNRPFLVLPPGSWMVGLGWSKNFDVVAMSGEVLFHGRAPYDNCMFQTKDLTLTYWYYYYIFGIGNKSLSELKIKCYNIRNYFFEYESNKDIHKKLLLLPYPFVNLVFDPRFEYNEKLFYGICTLVIVTNDRTVKVAFDVPRPGVEAYRYVGPWFFTVKFLEDHLRSCPDPMAEIIAEHEHSIWAGHLPLISVIVPPMMRRRGRSRGDR